MTDESEQSIVEISIGGNQLRMEGTEEFLSNELSEVLDRVDLSASADEQVNGATESQPLDSNPEPEGKNEPVSEEIEEEEETASESESTDSEIQRVAKRLDVDVEKLSAHFYVDEEEIHIHNPLNIEPKYALLGYCTIKEILTEDIYHDNKATKDKLIDVEKVPIDEWGRNLLPNLRNAGLIKDNTKVDRDRNKPFKITPSGRRELVEWLNENN